MFTQILIGCAVICGTIVIYVLFINALSYFLIRLGQWLKASHLYYLNIHGVICRRIPS